MDYVKDAEHHFGITDQFDEAFFIMPDGQWLDGSGRHWEDFSDDYESIGRIVDHFDVGELDWVSTANRYDNLIEFMKKTNAARCDMKHGIFAVLSSSYKYYPVLVKSFCEGARGHSADCAIYSPDGHIVKEITFSNVQPRKLLAWLQEHYTDKPTNVYAKMKKQIRAEIEKLDTIVMDLPLALRIFELCKETIKDDIHIHTLTEALLDLRTKKECLTMDDYPAILEMADIKPDDEETEIALDSIRNWK